MLSHNKGSLKPIEIDRLLALNSERSLNLDNSMIIGGNADGSRSFEQMAKEFINSEHPVKLDFAIGLLCLHGCLKISVNLTEYTLQENDLLMCPKDIIGQCHEFSEDCRISCIIMSDYNFIPLVNTRQGLVLSQFISSHNVLHLSAALMEKMQTIFSYMEDCLSDPDFSNKKETISAYMQIFLCLTQNEIQKKIRVSDRNVGNRSQQIFMNFISDLEKNCITERSIDFYAALQYISPRHLSAVIKENSGKTATELIRGYALLNAKSMLKSRRYTIQEVSIRMNFANQSFFGTWFKKATGMSPREYQEKG